MENNINIKNFTIVLPAYKESHNLKILLNEIQNIELLKAINIYIVEELSEDQFNFNKDDYSINLNLIRRTNKIRSLSASVIDSLEYINTKYLIIMDGDLQHNPNDILNFFKILKINDSDLIVGSRNLHEIYKSMKISRVIISKLGNAFAKLFIKQNISDPLTGYFLIKTDYFKEISKKLEYSGSKILFNILLLKNNINVNEIFIDFRKRKHGKSKLSINWFYYFLKIIFSNLNVLFK